MRPDVVWLSVHGVFQKRDGAGCLSRPSQCHSQRDLCVGVLRRSGDRSFQGLDRCRQFANVAQSHAEVVEDGELVR